MSITVLISGHGIVNIFIEAVFNFPSYSPRQFFNKG